MLQRGHVYARFRGNNTSVSRRGQGLGFIKAEYLHAAVCKAATQASLNPIMACGGNEARKSLVQLSNQPAAGFDPILYLVVTR